MAAEETGANPTEVVCCYTPWRVAQVICGFCLIVDDKKHLLKHLLPSEKSTLEGVQEVWILQIQQPSTGSY